MTAFARHAHATPSGTFTWELRSVNHRYLEPHFRIPDNLRELEPRLREGLRKKLARGKIDCSLRWQPAINSDTGVAVNSDALSALKVAVDEVTQVFAQTASVDPLAVLQWPGIVDTEQASRKELLDEAMAAFDEALTVLVDNRLREGAQLGPLFDSRLSQITAIVAEVRERLPAILTRQSEQIRQRFEDANVELDEGRLEQEMVLLAQKSDVAEELDRLDAHVKEVSAVLKKKEPVGRRLDFLMQELNREANTLSSKAIVTETTNAAVELKVLIEQMREQVQNIE
ncbi:MAG: YicC/YloC family endoribonuclease [Oleiphilaceae bacterium]|nr:YicC/YloC family endoribonuclease [Oleiphilaceae bacterium]